MAFVINDRVKETTTTTGTGAITFGGAVQGYETFAAGIGNSNTTYYAIYNPGTTEFEVGLGTLSGDSSTMARTTVISSSNSDNAVDFSAGTKDIFCTLPASKAPIYDSSGNLSLSGDLETNGNNIDLPTSSGSGVNRIAMGDSDEFQIYRTSSENTINTTGTGDLLFRVNGIVVKNQANNETQLETNLNGSVDLYYDNSKKLETTSTGVQTTGTISVNGAYTLPTSDGTSTQILQTDGSGALTFVDKPTAGASAGFVIAMAVAL